MKINKLIASAACIILPLSAFAWGQKGHDVTAFIAENHLTEKTKHAVDSILEGKSIVYWANWLDNASHTSDYDYTKTWHYKNIDAGVDYYEAPLHENGDIVRAVYEQVNVLMDTVSPLEDKQLALKIVVHIMGDMHQPMHMGHASDLGGNRHTVNYFGRDTNLHSVWDSSVPEAAHKWTYTEWQNQIDRASDEEAMIILAEGMPEKWAIETFEICKDVYDRTPENYKISYDYVADWTPVVEQQLLRGGLRLADILNSIFDPDYQPNNVFVKK